MIQYPMQFKVTSTGRSGIVASWNTQVQNTNPSLESGLVAAIPPEFEGPGGGYSPEDFYALALINCFIATFKVFAEKSKLEFAKIHAEGSLTVDRNEKGVPWMSAFHLKVSLNGTTDGERARRLLEKTSQSCMILNSVKSKITFEYICE